MSDAKTVHSCTWTRSERAAVAARQRKRVQKKKRPPNLQLERGSPVVVVGGRLSSLRPAAGQSVERRDAAAVLRREVKRNTIAVSKKCREGPVSDELCP